MSNDNDTPPPDLHFPSGEFKGEVPESVPDWYLDYVIKHKRGQFEPDLLKAVEMEIAWRKH